jgi:hypothetical protein
METTQDRPRTYPICPYCNRGHFPLVGDGIEDETVAVQCYLDHLGALPRGTYKTSETLKLN